MVIACPIPDWGLSGATTTILPRSFTASTRFIMPGAVMPSSFVIRITGFCFLPAAFVLLVFGELFFAGDFFCFAIFQGKSVLFFRHVQTACFKKLFVI